MRVLITRSRAQAGDLAQALTTMGAEPVFFPTISITPVANPGPLDEALQNLATYDWLIFTSTNAVEAVTTRLEILGLPFPAGLRVAAVGPKTAQTLAQHGLPAHFVPGEFTAEAILPGLGALKGKRVLLPLSSLAHDTLPRAIEAAGGTAHIVTAYHTRPAEPAPEGLAALRQGMDIITFTSGSTARNFAGLVEHAGLDPFHLPGNPLIVCIGPKTAAAARKAGFAVGIVAEAYTVEGLAAALGKQVDRVEKVCR